jgi:hypothetical protein
MTTGRGSKEGETKGEKMKENSGVLVNARKFFNCKINGIKLTDCV